MGSLGACTVQAGPECAQHAAERDDGRPGGQAAPHGHALAPGPAGPGDGRLRRGRAPPTWATLQTQSPTAHVAHVQMPSSECSQITQPE